MSLIQHVTSTEGVDREPSQLDVPFSWNGSTGYGTIDSGHSLRQVPSQQRSLRRVISYDVLANPEEPSQATDLTGGVTQYKFSTVRRVGKDFSQCP